MAYGILLWVFRPEVTEDKMESIGLTGLVPESFCPPLGAHILLKHLDREFEVLAVHYVLDRETRKTVVLAGELEKRSS